MATLNTNNVQSMPPKINLKLANKGTGDDNIKKIRKTNSVQRIGEMMNRNREKPTPPSVSERRPFVTRPNNKTKNEDNQVSEIFTMLKNYYSKRDNRDNCTVFGEHIANKLRNYDLLTRAEVEYKINCTVHEADLKILQGSYASLYVSKSQTTDFTRDFKIVGGSRSAVCIDRNK